MMRALFRYAGSKWGLAEWIISHFPIGYEKMVYLEPFAGSAAVFFNKAPSVVETINDLDGDIVNYFSVLRDRPEELARAIALTPYSREEYDLAFKPCRSRIEKARRFTVRTTQAIGIKPGKSGWRNNKHPNIGGTACKWLQVPGEIAEAAVRLKGSTSNLVQIEHKDAFELIARYDSSDTLMYLDPPYVMSSRRSGKLYRYELSDTGQERLLDLITTSKAKIVLSGYDNPLYAECLQGWQKDTRMSQTTSTEMAEECIWQNFEPPLRQIGFEDILGGKK